ncbi:MAG TPA: inositol monophosphatase family protein [Terriglobales bacterium]
MTPATNPPILSKATEIAREAGALLMGFFERRIGFEYKGDVDLVTEADRASEKLIVAQLRQNWPDYDLVGEEGSRDERGSEYRWYVDPLDGTTNFAHGYPVFCVSIGLEKAGELILGVLYDPTRDEMFVAEKGGGATLNGKPIHVSNTKRLCEAILGTGFPSHKRHKNPNIHFYHQITLRSHGVRRAGSAALDLANVASGRYDGFWEFNLNAWDTSAGVVLVREAGGTVTRFDGTPFQIDSREVLASNGLLHAELMQNFAEIFAGRGLENPMSPAEYAAQRNR